MLKVSLQEMYVSRNVGSCRIVNSCQNRPSYS